MNDLEEMEKRRTLAEALALAGIVFFSVSMGVLFSWLLNDYALYCWGASICVSVLLICPAALIEATYRR